jgi:Beta/Gamma crystallin
LLGRQLKSTQIIRIKTMTKINNQSNPLDNINLVQDITPETAANYSGGVGRIDDRNNDPDIIMYRDPNGDGRDGSIGINAAIGDGIPNIGFKDGVSGGGSTGLNDRVSSIRILRGSWNFFDDSNFSGQQSTGILRPGNYNLPANDDRITSALRVA